MKPPGRTSETAWTYVTPILERAGATVALVTLLGHSDADTASAGRVTLANYVAAVKAKLDAAEAPVVLVGHSMGGVAITQSAEQNAGKIAALVHLSAYLPENGRSLLDYSQDPESKLGPNIKLIRNTASEPSRTRRCRRPFSTSRRPSWQPRHRSRCGPSRSSRL